MPVRKLTGSGRRFVLALSCQGASTIYASFTHVPGVAVVIHFVLIAALLVPLKIANGEPGPVGQWLMSTPASMWALGMTKLEIYVQGWRGTHALAKLPRGAFYDWDQNRIIIFITTDEKFDENICSTYLNEARKSGGIYDGKLMEFMSRSFYSLPFERGFSLGDEPDDYLNKLDDIILVKIGMDGGRCEGRLISTEVLIGR